MSDSSRTTFVPSSARSWYLPRTAAARSVSGISSSSSGLSLIVSPLSLRYSARRDDADALTAVGMSHDDQPTRYGVSDCSKPEFVERKAIIRHRRRMWVQEYSRSFCERNSVLPLIRLVLLGIPLVLHQASLTRGTPYFPTARALP